MAEDDNLLNLADIQGNILRPYGLDWAGYLFVTVSDERAGRQWLGEIAAEVTSAAKWSPGHKPERTLNVGLSGRGMAALGVPRHILDSFSEPFRDGMVARASLLGDVGLSGPDHWDPGLRDGIDALVVVHAPTDDARDQRLDKLRERVDAEPGRLAVVHQVRSEKLPLSREHFGFADGFAQPAVEGSGHAHLPGQGTPTGRGRWAPIKAGEVVLGYEDEDGVCSPAPAAPLGHNGSYMVVRKLGQDVAAFRAFLTEAASTTGLSEDAVAAKVVGRWQDGTPLILSPDRPDPLISLDKMRVNDFRYGGDGNGARCPLGAHIRRANPRDEFGRNGKLTRRHRIIRRGMPYGREFSPGTGGEDRGLMFVCFNADIVRQFETIQSRWCNDGNPFGLDTDRDLLSNRPRTAGEPPNKMTIHGRSPAVLVPPDQPFVVTKGGEYLFAPGLTALRAIAGADW